MENYDFSSTQKIIDKMYEGDKDEIRIGIKHKAGLVRLNSLFAIAENEIKDDDIIQSVKELVSDDTIIEATTIGEYAEALLDVFGIKKYTGDNVQIKGVIKYKMRIDDM